MFKGIFVTGLIFIAQAIQADPAPQFGDIVRNTDGSVRYMSLDGAIRYCANQGMHLPSARELAQLSASMGAAGISETAKDGYYLVSTHNADGKTDNFYFNSTGYKRPAGDLGNHWFWSSSIASGGSDVAYNLFAWSGDVYTVNRYLYNYAFRCVAGR
jgi:hypothetical protein